jgi:hypothetical protein
MCCCLLSRTLAQQADRDETYFIMKSNGKAILRKAEIVLSRQIIDGGGFVGHPGASMNDSLGMKVS